jgi:uncharacterized repeat protein (TIGR01451 family)
VAAVAVLAVQAASAGAASADEADLAVTISDSPDPVTSGGAITYAIQVANAGPDASTGVILTHELPKGSTFVSAQPTQGVCSATSKGRRVTCTLGTFGVNIGPQYNPAPLGVTVSVLAPAVTRDRTVTSTARVDAKTKDPRDGNNSATATTRVVKAPTLTCRGRTVTIVGTGGPDLLVGTAGDDVMFAGLGDDRIFSFGGDDVVCAGPGGDVIGSGGGVDTVLAGPGADRAFGRGGGDALRGGRGPDRLRGGRGSDLLAGGLGRDVCFGGAGDDRLRSC